MPKDERYSLATWIHQLDYDDWDLEMVRDFSPGGRGMSWAARVERELAEEETISLSEGLARAKAEQEALKK